MYLYRFTIQPNGFITSQSLNVQRPMTMKSFVGGYTKLPSVLELPFVVIPIRKCESSVSLDSLIRTSNIRTFHSDDILPRNDHRSVPLNLCLERPKVPNHFPS